MERFFTTKKVAEMCHVSRGSVIRWINEGRLKAAVTAGGHNRVKSEDLVEFLQALRMPVPKELKSGHAPDEQVHVLVVDDEDGVRRMLQKFFRQTYPDFYVEEATDGFEAGVKAEKLRPEIMILDVVLPGIDGFRVCKSIKNNPDLEHTRILAITGFKGDKIRNDMIQLGADEFLNKPFTPEQLKERVDRLLLRIRTSELC